MILVCYDGSPDAGAAISKVAGLMPGAEATVLTIWEPFLDVMLRNGATSLGTGSAPYAGDADIDAASEQAALRTATAGAERATAAGLRAQPRVGRANGGTAEAILAAAGDVPADLVVLGTRGRGGVKSFLLGSVSHAVIQHADRSVLVVPSAELAEQRQNWSRHMRAPAGVT